MRFAALVPCSFVDWPPRLVAVAFTTGCNLTCRYCHNPALAVGDAPEAVAEEEVLHLLRRRRGKLDGLVVTGGEPTLQPGLAPFLRAVKREGFAVKLDTNGTLPEVVARLVEERLVDYLAVDLKALPPTAGWLTGLAQQAALAQRCIALAAAAGIEVEARTTVVSPSHDAAQLVALAGCALGARRWSLQRFRPGGHLDPGAELTVPDERLLREAAEHGARLGLAVSCR